MVSVRRERLREALSAKLGRAQEGVYELQQAERPEFNRYHDPQKSVVDFLHAARGVVPVVKTFAAERQQPGDFESWRDSWEKKLTVSERELWRRMETERAAQEHGEGAELMPILIQITRGDSGPQVHPVYAALGIKPSTSGTAKGGVKFTAYPDRPASEVCREYLALCQRFVNDFERDHAYLLT